MAARGINRAIVKTQPCQLLRRAGQCEHYAERGTSSPENVTGQIAFHPPIAAATSAKALDGMAATMTGIVKTLARCSWAAPDSSESPHWQDGCLSLVGQGING